MKYSIIIALLIVGIASFFGYERQQKIKTLTTELEELKKEGEELDVPTGVDASFSPRRAAQRAHKREREELVSAFIVDLISLIKESQKPGKQNDPDIQKRGIELIGTMLDFTPAELKMMVAKVAEDSTLKQQEKQQLTMFAIMMLANDNPDTALTLILESKGTDLMAGQMSQHMLTQALGSLARKDPVAAAQWLRDNSEKVGGAQDNLTRAIIAQASLQNVGLALDLIKDVEDQSTAYASIGSSITVERIDEFFNSIRGHDGSDENKARAFQSLAGSPFVKEPEAAIEWLNKTQLSQEEKTAFMEGMHYFQIKENPEAWMNWMVSQPEVREEDGVPARRNETTQNIIRNWAQNDFVAAGEWVGGLPEGETKNSAVLSYAGTLAEHEPAAAEDWAVTLPESVERTEVLKKIHGSLLPKDPAAAAGFAKRHGITSPDAPVEEE